MLKTSKWMSILIIVFGVFFTIIDMSSGPYFVLLGLILFFLNRKQRKDKKAKDLVGAKTSGSYTSQKPSDDIIKYSVFVAWWNKYPGVKALIDENMEQNEKYDGMTAKEIREELNDRLGPANIYEYPIIEQDVTFEPEPDNQYNPEAIKILCNGLQCGYVPDKNLARVRGILKNHPEARKYIEIKHGSTKYLDFDDAMDEKGKVHTDKNETRVNVRFEYKK